MEAILTLLVYYRKMKQIVFYFLVCLLGGMSALVIYFLSYETRPGSVVSALPDEEITDGVFKTAFSIENAPQQSLKGTITAMQGDSWWESRVATEPARLIHPVTLQQGETLIASESGQITAIFPGFLELGLLAPAELAIVQTLPVNLVFQQQKGEVYYSATGKAPVAVRSLRLLTTLPIGKMQIFVDDEKQQIRLTVLEGSATVAYNDQDIVSQVVSVARGQSFIFASDERYGRIE